MYLFSCFRGSNEAITGRDVCKWMRFKFSGDGISVDTRPVLEGTPGRLKKKASLALWIVDGGRDTFPS